MGSREEGDRFFSTDAQGDIRERYRTLMNTVGDGIYQLDTEGNFVAVNDVIVEKTGYAREDLLGEHVSVVLDDPDIERVERVIHDLLATKDTDRVATLELPVRTADGTTIPCELRLSILEDEHGFRGTVGVIRDISDRKARRELEAYRTIIETIPDGAYVLDEEYRFELVNDAFVEMTGYSREELLGSSVEMVSTDRGHERAQQLREHLRSGEIDAAMLEERIQTAGDESLETEIRFDAVYDETGAFQGTAGVVRDITPRKRLERELREERDLVEGIVETSPVGITVVDADGALTFANERAEEIFGRPREEITAHSHDDPRWDLVDERGEPLDGGEAPFDRVWRREEAVFDQIVGIRRPSGERVWLSVNGAPRWDEDADRMTGAVFAFQDITERRRLESELDEIFGRVTDAFYALDEEFRFTHVNERAEELLRAPEDELLGEELWEVFPEAADIDEVWEAFHAAMETQEPQSYELYFDPLEFWVEATVYPSETGVSVYFHDVTERKEREQRVRAERDLIERIVETSPIGIITLDADGSFDIVNERAEEILGYSAAELEAFAGGTENLDPVESDGGHLTQDDLPTSRVLEGETIHDVEIGVRGPDGDRVWLSVSGTPVRIDGERSGAVITFADVTERREAERGLRERERQLTEQRERLAALNRLNAAIRDVSLTAAAATSREEIEERICERLVDTDRYLFAWVGSVDRGQATVTPNAAAGAGEGYLDEIEITIDDAATGAGPTARAIRTGEPQFTGDVLNDPAYEPWREQARERGYRSSAALPLEHNDVTYGVLNVYADEPCAFDGPEGEMLAQLAELVGHAIAAVEQRKALVGDTLTELEFRIAGSDDPLLAALAEHDATVTVKRRIPVGEDRYVQFVTVRGMVAAAFESALAERATVTDVECIDEGDEESLFEVTTKAPPITEAVTSFGGRIRELTITGDAFRVIAEFPVDVDVREVFEGLQDRFPETELLAQRTTARSATSRQEFTAALTGQLTEKQRHALEAAYHAGYFDWPRLSTGEEVADLLDLSPATLAEHIRTAQRKLFATLFEDDPPAS